MNRDDLIAFFLARNGYSLSDAEPLAQDAGFRRYLRLRGERRTGFRIMPTENGGAGPAIIDTAAHSGEAAGSDHSRVVAGLVPPTRNFLPRPAVLMDTPPPEDVRPFLRIAAHLRSIGLQVPAIFAADEALGLVLEEDFGDDLLSLLLDRGDPPDPLLDAAVDALVVMQRSAPPEGLPVWDAAIMASTALDTLFDWWWPAHFGPPPPAAARGDVAAALATMLEPVARGPRCFVHRDYFAGNLLRLPNHRIGIIDFQGAALGHPAYDLVSLLQDARRDIPAASRLRGLQRFLEARPELDARNFQTAFTACAAQRHLRVACQWVRLAMRDGRPQYLAHGPRTWRLLEDALSLPAAEPLAIALNRWIPPADRGNPPGLVRPKP